MNISMIVLIVLLLIAAQYLLVRLCNVGQSNNSDSGPETCGEINQNAIVRMKKRLLDVA